jgi:hypothetical protein
MPAIDSALTVTEQRRDAGAFAAGACARVMSSSAS